jgi:hypothetical protein
VELTETAGSLNTNPFEQTLTVGEFGSAARLLEVRKPASTGSSDASLSFHTIVKALMGASGGHRMSFPVGAW